MGHTLDLWAGSALLVTGIVGFALFLVLRRLKRPVPVGAKEILNSDEKMSIRESLLTRLRKTFAARTSEQLERNKSGRRLRRTLERAGSPLRPGEYLLIVLVFLFVITSLMFFFRGWLGAVPVLFLGVVAARVDLLRRLSKRQKAFGDQLPDVLQMLASNLRSGQSMIQSIQMVGADAPSPTREEFKRVLIEQRIGRDLTSSFRDLSDRVGSKDFEWVVSAIDINRSVGGDLSIILDRIERTIRARNRIRGQVSAMSAEGKLSGIVLIALPPAIMVLVQIGNPAYLEPLLQSAVGWALLGLAVVMLSIGGFWIMRLSRFVY